MNPDPEMTPSTEDTTAMRVAIAEKLGWKHDPMHGPLEAQWLKPDGTRARNLEPWDSDANAALLLVEHMRKEGYLFTYDNDLNWELHEVVFYKPDESEFNASYTCATTLPLAICKAFCLANNINIDPKGDK